MPMFLLLNTIIFNTHHPFFAVVVARERERVRMTCSIDKYLEERAFYQSLLTGLLLVDIYFRRFHVQ